MTSEIPAGEVAQGPGQTVEIVVRGSARRRYRAERAHLHLRINVSGADRASVFTDAVAVHGRLLDAVRAREADGTVTSWSSDSVHVTAHRPIDQDGRPTEPVYTADLGVDVDFVAAADSDGSADRFAALSTFTDEWAVADGVHVGGVNWDVAEDNRRTYEHELRLLAVGDAVAKAQAYADAVGRGTVTATQLADPGMSSDPAPRAARFAMMSAAPDAGPELELRPREIDIAVAVDARFVAS
ncbi:hypothetical protein GCM10009624_19330 [Gordonia sinesedis]